MYIYFEPNVIGRNCTLAYLVGEKEKETEKAVCFSIKGNPLWFPKNAIIESDDVSVTIAHWFKFSEGYPYNIFSKNVLVVN